MKKKKLEDIEFKMSDNYISGPPAGYGHNPVSAFDVLNEMRKLNCRLSYSNGSYPIALVQEGDLTKNKEIFISFDLINLLMQVDRVVYEMWRMKYGD